MSATADKKCVVIIGAGASGMAAATRLYENGMTDILVLEAENRIGGRVYTVNVETGYVEMGAEWIHGEEDNVVHELASRRDLVCDPGPGSPLRRRLFVRSSGELIGQDLLDRICELFMELLDRTVSNEKSFPNYAEYHSHLFKSMFSKHENSDIPEEMRPEIEELYNRWQNSLNETDSWCNAPPCSYEKFKVCNGDLWLMWDRTSYRKLFDVLMERSKELSNGSFESDVVSLNHEVTQISMNERESGITVECSNGRKIIADYVLITMSVGALQEVHETLFKNISVPEWINDGERLNVPTMMRGLSTLNVEQCGERICPPLQLQMHDDVIFQYTGWDPLNMELGTVDKIYLEFSSQWWPNSCPGFELLWTKRDREEYVQKGLGWVTHISQFLEVAFAPHVLCASICGAPARSMESLSEEFVRDTVVQMLRRILSGKAGLKVPDPIRFLRSTWYSNKHFRGSGSYHGWKAEEAKVSASSLSRPVYNTKGELVLLFAGEATSPHYFGTVHGAVESGWREADRLLSLGKIASVKRLWQGLASSIKK